MTRKLISLVFVLLVALIPLSRLTRNVGVLVVRASPGTITVPDDFATIQEAINHAGHGDLINVRNGTYYEHVVVNKSVALVGENPLATIVDGSNTGIVILVTRSDVLLKGFTIRYSGLEVYDAGVWITADNVTTTANVIADNSWGIGLSDAAGSCQIHGNNITGGEHSGWHSWGGGVYLVASSSNSLVGNMISCSEDHGIYLSDSSYNDILGNTFTNQSSSGIHVSGSNNIIHHNNFMDTNSHVVLESGTNTWNDDYPAGGNYWSDYTGSDLFSGEGQNVTGSDGIGDTPYVVNENNTDRYPRMQPYHVVRNLDTGLCYVSLQSAISAAETTEGQTIFAPSGTYPETLVVNKGVALVGDNAQTTLINGRSAATIVAITAASVTISGFTISDSAPGYGRGVHVESTHSHISDLIITHTYYGILLENCDDCTVTWNRVANNTHGISSSNCSCTHIFANNVSSNSGFGIALTSSSNCSVEANTVSYNSHGVYLVGGNDDNTVCRNVLLNNSYGVLFDNDNDNNAVHENTVHDNFYGICVYGSSNNAIYYNNFQNTNQAYSFNSVNDWNNSALEGNYWSDYTGLDANGDGIGDTWYPIEEDAEDRYPLINPVGSVRNTNTGLSYLSIQAAIDAAETLAGHTIRIEAGVHGEHIVVDKPLSIEGRDKTTTAIIGPTSTEPVITVAADNVTLRELTVKSNGGTETESGIYILSSNHTTVHDCIIKDNSDGIFLNRSHSSRIENNSITDNHRGLLLSHSSNNTILHNTVSNNTLEGLQLLGPEVHHNLIADNNVSHNGYGTLTELDGILLYLSPNNTISSNTVSLNARDGIRLTGSRFNSLSNNKITANVRAGISLEGCDEGNATDNVITGNTIADNDIGIRIVAAIGAGAPTAFSLVSMIPRTNDDSTMVQVDPSTTSVLVGTTFTINVTVSNVVNLTAWEVRLYYLKSLLNCTGIAEGPFLRSGGASTSWPLGVSINNDYNSTHGRIVAPDTVFGQTWVSGSGVLATVTFKAQAPGDTLLRLGSTLLDNTPPPNAQEIPHKAIDGIVSVDIEHSNADRNLIYHNNLLNNTNQIQTALPSTNFWDNGCEGNYWSDYTGLDANGDGIGDTLLPWQSVDQYPLMNFYWNPVDVDHDLDVDIFDVVRVATAYGTTPAEPKWNCHCDIAPPYQLINIFDVVMVAGSYGERYTP